MSVVVVNVLTVPAEQAGALEERFAGRAGLVDKAVGFEGFALLRPVAGTDRYLVWTRWRSEADFRSWQASQAFGTGHGGPDQPGGAAPRPAAGGSEVWQFEVVLDSPPG